MNKKAQLIGFVFSLIVFIILWAMFFAEWLADWSQSFIEAESLTGLSAFLVANMNLWVLFGLIIGTISLLYLGGRN